MDMPTRARKNESIILGEISRVGLDSIAVAVQRDTSTISRWKDAEIHRLATLLAVCGLKVVPETMRCARPEVIEALETLSRVAINQQHSLVWDD
jgi:hypothetical protein